MVGSRGPRLVRVFPIAGARFAFERARPSPEAPTRFGPERGSVHDWRGCRVEKA